MPPLAPPIGRALYKALQTSAAGLQHELARCGTLRSRELDALRAASAAPLPKDLRGLLDVRALTAPRAARHVDFRRYVSAVARRIAEAAQAPEFEGLEAVVGFAALKHLNARVDALRHLVYETSSDAERFGIRVGVESTYQGADRERFYFRYQVRISNASEQTVQLLSRAWTIRDLNGRVTSVEGPGVVGAFPTLAPTESYEYSSAVPLSTPVGTQSGHYVFLVNGTQPIRAEELSSKMLQVPVAPFSYRTPSMDTSRKESGAFGSSAQLPRGGKGSSGRRRRNDDMKRR